jgi:hypothetical protein
VSARTAGQWRNLAAQCKWTQRSYTYQQRAAMMKVYKNAPSPDALDAWNAAFMRGLMAGRAQAYKEIAEEI